MRITWCTDIHLDLVFDLVGNERFISESKVQAFCAKVMATKPDCVVITGDISQASSLEIHLMWLEMYLPGIKVFFVLGNHDFYSGSILSVRAMVDKYDGTMTRTCWLNKMGVVKLTDKTALVGHDGWYDGGYANWFRSLPNLKIGDYDLIADFRFQPPLLMHKLMNDLSQQAADHIDEHVVAAAKAGFPHVLFATHVPPFRENSRSPDGSMSPEHSWLPVMASRRAGDALKLTAQDFPETKFLCLSGHTHTAWEQDYGPNLKCLTGKSVYGSPHLSIRVLEIE